MWAHNEPLLLSRGRCQVLCLLQASHTYEPSLEDAPLLGVPTVQPDSHAMSGFPDFQSPGDALLVPVTAYSLCSPEICAVFSRKVRNTFSYSLTLMIHWPKWKRVS